MAHAGIAAGFHLHMATHLSPEIGLVSAVGNDFPIDAQTTLENSGLNLAGVIRKDGSTFRWSGRYQGSMNDVTTISTEVNVLEDYIPEIPPSWKNPNVLFCANTHPRSQVAVLDQCPGAEITALDSFMLVIETEFELLSEALRKVDLAILNEEEVCAIAGDDLVQVAPQPRFPQERLCMEE